MRDQPELAAPVAEHDASAICSEALVDHLQRVDDHKNAGGPPSVRDAERARA
jgi:hypothetical protein